MSDVRNDISGTRPIDNPAVSSREKGILLLLATLLGSFGVDRFYRGQVGLGILKLLTGGGCGIWALIDGIVYMVGQLPTDTEGRVIIDGRTRDRFRSGLVDYSMKDKGVLILLASLLGIFGVDRFYRGQVGIGIIKLLTFGGVGLWAIIDCIIYMVADLPMDSNGMLIADRKTLEFLSRS